MAEMPKEVGVEAQQVAIIIDRVMEDLLTEAGLPRVNRTGATVKWMGLLVQYAIDMRMERLSAERMDS
jgi:hypothetical protein